MFASWTGSNPQGAPMPGQLLNDILSPQNWEQVTIEFCYGIQTEIVGWVSYDNNIPRRIHCIARKVELEITKAEGKPPVLNIIRSVIPRILPPGRRECPHGLWIDWIDAIYVRLGLQPKLKTPDLDWPRRARNAMIREMRADDS